MDQIVAAESLIAELECAGHDDLPSVLDILDSLACAGLVFAPGTAASAAYMDLLQRQ